MTCKRIIFSVLLLWGASYTQQSFAKVVVIAPKEDISVYGNARNGNTYFYSGIYAGNVFNGGVARMYEKFSLPEYVAGNSVTSALFEISYSPGQSYMNGPPLQIWAMSNDWEGGTLTRGGTPVIDYTALLGKIKSGINSTIYIDLTDFANQQYQKNAGAMSFVIMSKNEGRIADDFTYFDEKKSLHLTLTSAVPEPSTYAMMLMGLLTLLSRKTIFSRARGLWRGRQRG
nr:DNRLRE domain-containing protein [uncultured Janthinobacterium sp.]